MSRFGGLSGRFAAPRPMPVEAAVASPPALLDRLAFHLDLAEVATADLGIMQYGPSDVVTAGSRVPTPSRR